MWVGLQSDEDEIPQELLLGKHQLHELCGDSAKMKTMGIFHKVNQFLYMVQHVHEPLLIPLTVRPSLNPQFSSSKLVKILNILERNIQDSVKLSTLLITVSWRSLPFFSPISSFQRVCQRLFLTSPG